MRSHKFGRKLISLILALMCVATVAAVSASAETASQSEFDINRPYSNMPIFDNLAYSFKHDNSKYTASQINDLRGNDVVFFSTYSIPGRLGSADKSGFGGRVSLNLPGGNSYRVGKYTDLYKNNHTFGGHNTYEFDTPKNHFNQISTPDVHFSVR